MTSSVYTCTWKPTKHHQTLSSLHMTLKVICTGAGWGWLVRLLYKSVYVVKVNELLHYLTRFKDWKKSYIKCSCFT